MEHNDDDFNYRDLKNIINAQTEAYVEFNNALVRIIELQKQIKEEINRVGDTDLDELKGISEKITKVTTLLELFTDNKNSLANEMDEYNAVLSDFGSELQSFKFDLERIILTQAANNEYEKLNRSYNDKTNNLKSILDTLGKKVDSMQSTQEKAYSQVQKFLWGLGGAWFVIQFLISIGLYNLKK